MALDRLLAPVALLALRQLEEKEGLIADKAKVKPTNPPPLLV
jgi:hypothetical protein